MKNDNENAADLKPVKRAAGGGGEESTVRAGPGRG